MISKKTINQSLSTVETMYRDYFNNWLTVERFAEYYGLSNDEANFIIDAGRQLNYVFSDYKSLLDNKL